MNDLKPCPFCAGRAIYTNVEGVAATTKTYWCKCSRCGPGEIIHTVDQWNNRPIEVALLNHASMLDAAVGNARSRIGGLELENARLRTVLISLTTGVNGEGVRQICLEALK